jgi:hypothetical protein
MPDWCYMKPEAKRARRRRARQNPSSALPLNSTLPLDMFLFLTTFFSFSSFWGGRGGGVDVRMGVTLKWIGLQQRRIGREVWSGKARGLVNGLLGGSRM